MIGTHIRKRRRQQGLSLRELAERAGVTASFVSQVERNLVSPSLQSLKAIARALDVPVFYFLLDEETGGYVVRKGKRRKLSLPDPALDYELLTPDLKHQMLVFMARYEPQSSSEALVNKPGVEECIFVLQGRLEIELAGGTYRLDAGDSVYFEAVDLRRIATVGDQELIYLSVSSPPAF